MKNIVPYNNQLSELNLKQRMFLKEYFKCGSATRSYQKIYKVDEASAAVLASRLLKKVKNIMCILFELHGLTEAAIVKILKDACNATKIQIYNGQKYEVPDHYIRLKSVELVKHITGMEYSSSDSRNTQTNVVVINDKKRGVFEVTDGEN